MDGARVHGSREASSLAHVPALDGIRALAVVAVLAFHGGVSWVAGGYLGVSTFFTLSGFLITSLLLLEAERHRSVTGRASIDLRAFWVRRVRRILPASLAGIALSLAFASQAGDADQRRRFGGDVAAALGDVANWRFLLSGQSYADLFAAPSPLLHYWSLAIEEQFYLLLPLLALGMLTVARRARARHLATFPMVGFAVLLLTPLLATILLSGRHDRVYYGTDTRAAELLIGCVLATVVHRFGGVDRLAAARRRLRVALAGCGCVALAASVAAWSAIEQSSDLVANGGLVLFGAVSAGLVAGALVRGPVKWLLATPPLVWLGRISYGVYVYHWPLFLWLAPDRVGWSPPALLALRFAATLALAVVSFRYLEQPIRHRRRPAWLPLPSRYPAAATAAAVLLLAANLSSSAPPPPIDFEAVELQFQAELAVEAPPPEDLPSEDLSPLDPPATDSGAGTPGTDAPARVVPVATLPPEDPPAPWLSVFGDRTASLSTFELLVLLNGSPDAHFADGSTTPLCSLLRGTLVHDVAGVHANDQTCDKRDEAWGKARDLGRADVAVIQLGAQDLYQHDFGNGDWRAIGEPGFDERLSAELDDVIGLFSGGAVMLFALPTDWNALGPTRPWLLDAATYSIRARQFNTLLDEAAKRHPDRTTVFDFDAWLAKNGGPQALRPDGVKVSSSAGTKLALDMTAQAIALHRVVWQAAHPPPTVPVGTSDTPPPAPTRAQRVLIAGDSTGLAVGVGLHAYADATGTLKVASVARSSCGIVRGGKLINKNIETDDTCPNWKPIFDAAVKRFEPDVALVVDALWEITDHQLPGDKTWRTVGDPVYERYLTSELVAAFEALHAGGAVVAVMLYPHIDLNRYEPRAKPYIGTDPSRMDRFNQILRTIAASRPYVKTIDFQAFARTFPGGEMDATMRPDGVHLTSATAFQVADTWLAAQLRALT